MMFSYLNHVLPYLILKEFHLYTDASGGALGTALSQLDENNLLHLVAFASSKLKDLETRYATTETKSLALVWAP